MELTYYLRLNQQELDYLDFLLKSEKILLANKQYKNYKKFLRDIFEV